MQHLDFLGKHFLRRRTMLASMIIASLVVQPVVSNAGRLIGSASYSNMATWGGNSRHLLNNIGVLTQQEFILVVISSVIGFLLIVALVLMFIYIFR